MAAAVAKSALVVGAAVRAGELRAEDLAELLRSEIMDAEDAAKFLGLARNSIEYAAYRRRIPYVQYGAKKLFTRADLMDYHARKGRGRESKLQNTDPIVVKDGKP